MPRIAGVITKKNAKDEIISVTIDVKKHHKIIMPVLEKLGVVKKTKFMQEFENGISVEEARKIYLKHIDELWKK